MRRSISASGWLVLSALIAGGCATAVLEDFDNSYSLSGPDKTLAFVGRKVEFAQLVGGVEDPNVIVMDMAFAARYEILQVVHGEYDRQFIDFEAYDHYGSPAFARHDVAMIYIAEHDGRLYHRKYQWDPVNRTSNSSYAYCGDPYFWLDEDELKDVEKRPLEEIEFDPPVVTRISDQLTPKINRDLYTKEELAARRASMLAYYAPPAFDVRGDRATCRMGVYPDELYRIKYETQFLPQKRREHCEDSVGYTSADWQNAEKNEAVLACVAKMAADGGL